MKEEEKRNEAAYLLALLIGAFFLPLIGTYFVYKGFRASDSFLMSFGWFGMLGYQMIYWLFVLMIVMELFK
jgi:hypothetical protein